MSEEEKSVEKIELVDSVDVPNEDLELITFNQISLIEKSNQQTIMAIHENMQKLIDDCNSIVIDENDPESYKKAVELKREVKNTHVSIKNKRDELKRPLLDYGKRLDEFVSEIYDPLKKAESVIKSKMERYEVKLAKIKAENKLKADAEKNRLKIIEDKMLVLNSQLSKITSAQTLDDIEKISTYINSIKLSDFADKQDEAGFIITQLKGALRMATKVVEMTIAENQAKETETDEINQSEIESENEPIQEETPEKSEPTTDEIEEVNQIDSDINQGTLFSESNDKEEEKEEDVKDYLFSETEDSLPDNEVITDLVVEEFVDYENQEYDEDLENVGLFDTGNDFTDEEQKDEFTDSVVIDSEEKIDSNEQFGTSEVFDKINQGEPVFPLDDSEFEEEEESDEYEKEEIDVFGDILKETDHTQNAFDIPISDESEEKLNEAEITNSICEITSLKDLDSKSESELIDSLTESVYKTFSEILDVQLLKVLESKFNIDLFLDYDRCVAIGKKVAIKVGKKLQDEY